MLSNRSGRLSRTEAAVLALLELRLVRDVKARRPKAA
jgi:hypothetical protein